MRYWGIALLFWVWPVLAQTFLPGTEDIPLMKDLTNVEETASFDNPSERLVLISAETKIPPKSVFQFYSQSLGNLGWQEIKPHFFKRGNDSFTIEINQNQVQFRLSQSNS